MLLADLQPWWCSRHLLNNWVVLHPSSAGHHAPWECGNGCEVLLGTSWM